MESPDSACDPDTQVGWADQAAQVSSGIRKGAILLCSAFVVCTIIDFRSILKSGAEEMRNSIVSGQLPDISVGQLVPSVELHKLRGPFMFCGIGQPQGFNVPTCSELVPRVKINLAVFSANYLGLALFIAVCTTITNMTFIFIVAALALFWNKVLKMNAADEVRIRYARNIILYVVFFLPVRNVELPGCTEMRTIQNMVRLVSQILCSSRILIGSMGL